MKMLRNEIRDVEVETDRICNKCGNSCRQDEYNYGGFSASIVGGYSSTVIDDGAFYAFDICEECAKEFMDTFKITAYENDIEWDYNEEQSPMPPAGDFIKWDDREEPELDYEPGTSAQTEKKLPD